MVRGASPLSDSLFRSVIVASTYHPCSCVSPGIFSGNSASRTGKGDRAAGSGANRYRSYSMEKSKPPGRLILFPAGLLKAVIISSMWRISISLRLPNNSSMAARSRCRFRAEGNSRNLSLSKIMALSCFWATPSHKRIISPSR
ncbi:hypothetical protein ES703_44170 [subsurface metagenome]